MRRIVTPESKELKIRRAILIFLDGNGGQNFGDTEIHVARALGVTQGEAWNGIRSAIDDGAIARIGGVTCSLLYLPLDALALKLSTTPPDWRPEFVIPEDSYAF